MCILLYNLSKCILICIHEFICSFMQWMSFEKILCPSTGHALMNKSDLRGGLYLSPLPHLTLRVKLAFRLILPVDPMASCFPFLLGAFALHERQARWQAPRSGRWPRPSTDVVSGEARCLALAIAGSQSGWWRIQFMKPPLHTYWVLDFSGPIKMTDRFLDYGVGRWVSN